MVKKLAVMAVLVALAVGGFVWFNQEEPIAVRMAVVERGVVESTVANTRAGTIKACQRSRLSMPMGGQVDALLVEEGDRVKKGQVLIRLWNKDQAARLLDAQARVLASQQSTQEACQTARLEAREYTRLQGLEKRKLVSVTQLDTAKTRAKAAAAACSAAKAIVKASQAVVKLQEAIYEKSALIAPFDGVVAEINGEVGEYITPSPSGVATPPAIDLIGVDCLYVTAPIDEVDAADIELGMPVRVSLDAFRGRRFDGVVTRIAPYVKELEKQARTVDVDVALRPMPTDVELLIGYSADIEIITQRREQVLRLPTEAVMQGAEVLRFDPASQRLMETRFTPGLSNWTFTQVTDGLEAGDQVLLSLDTEGAEAGALVTPQASQNERP